MEKGVTPDLFTEAAIEIAERAGDAILQVYERGHTVHEKADRSPLTEADLASHALIVEELSELAPDIPIVSEESPSIPWSTRRHWQRHWLVDPLDGTKEFIKRNGEFTVNIALIEHHEPILGIVVAPCLNKTYWAIKEHGAHLRDAHGSAVKLQVRSPAADASGWSIVGSRSHGTRAFDEFLSRFENAEVVTMGSSLKFCLIAEGKADLYPRFGPTYEWDTAAAQCIVEEAGGAVLELGRGSVLRYNTKESLLNPSFIVSGAPADQVRSLLAGYGAGDVVGDLV